MRDFCDNRFPETTKAVGYANMVPSYHPNKTFVLLELALED